MTPKLNWKQDSDGAWRAKIFLDYSLVIRHNGEDWYNVKLLDQRDSEINRITGAKTILQAKTNALFWVNQELRKVTT